MSIAWNRIVQPLAPIAHCEGITVGPDGRLYAGDEAGRLFRIDPDSGAHEQVADVGGYAVGLCVDGDGLVYVCVYDRGAVVRVDPATGEVDVYCDSVEGGRFPSPNWNLFAPDGTMYVSDSCAPGAHLEYVDVKSGRVVAVPPGGGDATALPARPIGFSNGMALHPEGSLFIAETFVDPGIVVWRDGRLSDYCKLPRTVPDGLAFDDEGGLFVSMYQPNQIVRIPPGGGEPELLVDDWRAQWLVSPTNIAFCGPERRTLAIASLLGSSLFRMELPWRGVPLHYPSLRR